MAKRIITTIFSLIILAAFLFFGIKLELKMNEYRVEKIRKTETITEVRKGRDVDFEKLRSRNKDVKGWIYLPDSEIDYPVVQAADNDYYLHRGLDGEYAFEGTIFIDAECADPFHEKNTVIYGHHMNSGSMLSGLDKYKDKDYFRKHRIIQLMTEDGDYDLHVIAYCNKSADSELYTIYPSTVNEPEEGFFDDEDFKSEQEGYEDDEWSDEADDAFDEDEHQIEEKQFADIVRENADVLTKEEFDDSDRFVTLSTCAYNFQDARHQVICVIRPAATETKEIVKEMPGPTLNKWLWLQIGAAIVMFIAVIGELSFVFGKNER